MEDILKEVLEVVLPIIGALLTALSSYAITLLTKRMGIKLNAEKEEMLRSAVRSGIAGAEEWAARRAKIEPHNISGAEKAKWLHDRLKKMYPNLAPQELHYMIDEELAKITDVGATGVRKVV
tara:strand:+ start:187 stop:552 length:366 start_codon:yes stop_codon:yes gene_type:complete